MAKALNKSRIGISKILIITAVLLVVFTKEIDDSESLTHALLDLCGYLLVVACGMGRLYTTAFLGGYKNKELITYGPFSIMRNPLYFFSWLGFTGFALFSNNLLTMILVPVGFIVVYHFLVKREETYLLEKFGDTYREYCKNVPRFIPRFSIFQQPDELVLTSRTFLKGLLDNVWWFIIPPLFEFIEFWPDFKIF